ncbi:MAG: HNH endonuclease [Acidobacteria bacterium]|nr:HNH endonuclease [Acidobacteriota bacterium]
MPATRRINYRKIAFDHYPSICACCGFGIPDVLEVAHVDGNRQNNEVENLVILCPNCHKMHDINLFPTHVVVEMRDREKAVDWSKRMKDAGKKAALTRKRREARKAVETREKGKKDLHSHG